MIRIRRTLGGGVRQWRVARVGPGARHHLPPDGPEPGIMGQSDFTHATSGRTIRRQAVRTVLYHFVMSTAAGNMFRRGLAAKAFRLAENLPAGPSGSAGGVPQKPHRHRDSLSAAFP